MEEATPSGRANGARSNAARKIPSAAGAPDRPRRAAAAATAAPTVSTSAPVRTASKATTKVAATKKAPAKKAARPPAKPAVTAPTPVEPAPAEQPVPAVEPPPDPVPAPAPALFASRPAPLWAKVFEDPLRAPDQAAREAVRRLGPAAGDWVARMRARYPDASADGLARLAILHCVQQARRTGAAAGAGGASGGFAGAGALAYAQAGLVLRVAAAYGLDPTSDERAAELLVLMRVPHRDEPLRTTVTHLARMLATMGVWQAAARMMPFGRVVAGAVVGTRTTADAGARAVAHYRNR